MYRVQCILVGLVRIKYMWIYRVWHLQGKGNVSMVLSGRAHWMAHHFGWVGWHVWKSGVGCFVSPASDGAVWSIKM